MTEDQILEIDRGNEVANCSVTLYRYDPMLPREENFASSSSTSSPRSKKPARRLRRSRMSGSRRSRKVTRATLSGYPLPVPGSDGDKETRGRVLVVGGEVSLPGAVVLAGIAALRAGAGKLQLATCASIAVPIGVAVPESLSLGLRETAGGSIHPGEARKLREMVRATDALLIGPGTTPSGDTIRLTRSLIGFATKGGIVLDAAALELLRKTPDALHRHDGNAVLTPHAAEMSMMTGIDEAEIEANAYDIALQCATTFGAVVALKGPVTFIASPEGGVLRFECGDVGLATSGSGDTLAGIVAGLLARGADPFTAALWGVYLHGEAGNALARRIGRIGYLARELLDEIPSLMR